MVADYISIQNEPDYDASWASCRFAPSQTTSLAGYNEAFEAVYTELYSRMDANMPKMLVAETAGLNNAGNYINVLNDLSHVYGYAHHLYNCNDGGNAGCAANPDNYISRMTSVGVTYNDKPILQTEYADRDHVTSYEDCMNLAVLMHNSLAVEGVAGYLYWQLTYGPGEGLVSITNTSWTINPVYYAMKHYSAFTDPGWHRVGATTESSDLRISAFINPDGNELSVVIINTSPDANIPLDLSLPGLIIDNGDVYQTTATQQCELVDSYDGTGTLMIPAYSITTLVLTIVPPEQEWTLEGEGTAEQPYLIRDGLDLGQVWLKPQAHYRLDVSVDLTDMNWPEAVIPWFAGTFDGNDHVISNLHIQGSDNLGLFGQLSSEATILNLGLEAVDVNGTDNYIGSLAGDNDGSIENCYATGDVNGIAIVGGLVGGNEGRIADCYVTCDVNGIETVGGLVGENNDSIEDCYTTCDVNGVNMVGGLVGDNRGRISSSFTTGTVRGQRYVGGLVGDNDGSVLSCYSSVDVNGVEMVGGLLGWCGHYISNCYATGDVNGVEMVGGLVGCNGWFEEHGGSEHGYIYYCYSIGSVQGTVNVGGLVGYKESNSIVSRSFWDEETSGQYDSDGGIGLITTEMQTKSTFTDENWDFDNIWDINDTQTYPYLRIQTTDE
jgi:hypothetical protein